MWGLAISAATIIASSILSSSDNNEDTSCESRSDTHSQDTTIAERSFAAAAESPSTEPSIPANDAEGSSLALRRDFIFFSGTLLGSGMAIFLTALTNHYRVEQRMRHWMRKLWCVVIEQKRLADVLPFRIPAPPQASREILHDGGEKFGKIQVLVSPQNSPTSQLHVSLITLQPGAELPMHSTHSVEFYQVLQGSGGTFSQQGMMQELPINKGDCFVVDPDTLRWISNCAGTEPLVLLRSTDGGHRRSGAKGSLEALQIQKDTCCTNHQQTTAAYEALLTESLRGVI